MMHDCCRAVLILAALSLLLGVHRDAPAPDPQAEHHVIGLYIGIGSYPNIKQEPLRLHTTNRDALLPLLQERFGVEWLPPLIDADRAAIRDGLLALLSRAQASRDSGRDVTALVFYTGHGSRVQDQDGDEADDDLDETWVSVNSSLADGEEDIRDDDISALRAALAHRGVHLTLIIEACHSESSFRGSPSLSLSRGGMFPAGPPQRLFAAPEFDSFYAQRPKGPLEFIDGPADQRFVCLSACRDRELAQTVERDGAQWGVLSLSLARALAEAPADVSYGDVLAAINRHARAIREEHRKAAQTPAMTFGAPQLQSLRFLGRSSAPAVVRLREVQGHTAVANAGVESGLVTGTLLEVYATHDDLAARREPIGSATVEMSDLGSARVRGSGLAEHAVVRVVSSGLPAEPAFLEPALPETLRKRIAAESHRRGLSITADPAAAVLQVEPASGADGVEVRWTLEDKSAPQRPPPLVSAKELPAPDEQSLAANVAEELERIVRLRRLMHLRMAEDDIGVRIEAPGSGAQAQELREVPDGSGYVIRLTNNANTRRSFALLEITEPDTGGMHGAVLIPSRTLRAGETWEIPVEKTLLPEGATREAVTHVWLSSAEPLANAEALVRSGSLTQASRGASPSSVLANALLTRSVRGGDAAWAARVVRFDIVAAPPGAGLP